ncbi:MAG TPA: tRNA (N6-isopentenyl adenosine(37)-C2)-methylthiotransferase MiaB, partial [bacterium]|nr:tRNA (N6-isopentenyl adenosine(37)-C2)-methylthiotransferase MiaB [bacterium]
MNVYDSERISVMLINSGWVETTDAAEAKLIIINSCSVREKPLQKLFSCAGRYLPYKKNTGLRIFITGCVAQQLGKDILEKAPYIDGIFGPGSEYMIPDIIQKGIFPFVSNETDFLEREEIFPASSRGNYFNRHTASVTVMHGCSNYCSYCIVPFVRGREISRRSKELIDEINLLCDNGVVEITLLGQNVNSYKDPGTGIDFTDMLYEIAEKTPVQRIRFITSHPKDFDEKLAKSFSEIPQLMPYLHLPAQSGSDRILKKMNRNYTLSDYLKKLELSRKFCPDIALSSDFIVGFPGEKEADFNLTMELVERADYDVIFAFNYSPRPFTKSFKLKDDLSTEEKLLRLNKLLDLQKKKIKEVRHRYLSRTVKVLVENRSPKSNSFMGRTEHNLITHITDSTEKDIGKIIDVKITEILENTLRG